MQSLVLAYSRHSNPTGKRKRIQPLDPSQNMSYRSPSEHRMWTRCLSMDKLRQYRRLLETTPEMKRFSIRGGGNCNSNVVDAETDRWLDWFQHAWKMLLVRWLSQWFRVLEFRMFALNSCRTPSCVHLKEVVFSSLVVSGTQGNAINEDILQTLVQTIVQTITQRKRSLLKSSAEWLTKLDSKT